MNEAQVKAYLLEQDPKLAKVLKAGVSCPFFEEPKISQYRLLSCLVEIIIGQQVSNSAAQKIWNNFKKNTKTLKVLEEKILGLENHPDKREGLSGQKITYLKGIVVAMRDQEIKMNQFSKQSDDEVMENLTRLKGIGPWTAEMFLMFGLHRLDVFSNTDYGLIQSVKKLYKNKTLSIKEIDKITHKWRPYRSVASWYLWLDHDG